MSKPRIGLVCSGGGARGAYEAGVIRYLREELPKEARAQVRFDVLCGTSIGAMTCALLAGSMHQPETQGQLLCNLWRGLSLERVFKVEGESLISVGQKIWKAVRNTTRPDGWRLHDLLHPDALESIVHSAIDWSNISSNLAKGLFHAISVSATRIRDGRTVVFVQRKEPGLPAWSRDPYTEAQDVVLGPEHALASGAIPLLFRSVQIGTEYFCDGSVRQTTPLSPALRLGADRVLILTMQHKPSRQEPPPAFTRMPTVPVVVGRVLSSLMIDRADTDLDRLRRLNTMLETGQLTYGDEFARRMNDTIGKIRGQPYRVVRDLVIRPSRDLASIARPHLEARAKREAKEPLPTRLLHRLTGSPFVRQAELGSYLLFDGPFANDLIELGMADAHAKRDALIDFFDPHSSSHAQIR